MRVTRLVLRNWRNFKHVDITLSDRVLIFGPNAVGKSNLLDSMRFLRDLTTSPGGLQFAVESRGGIRRVRFLNARSYNSGRVTIAAHLGDSENPDRWVYELTFTAKGPGGRAHVVSERIHSNGELVHDWSDAIAATDPELASQTALEQVAVNGRFRDLVTFLGAVEYLHLVPQVVRDSSRGGALKRDPFGGTFLAEVGRTPVRDFERRRKVMAEALGMAVAQFESLNRRQDADGSWHLEAKYRHFRPNATAQDERDFSDGTLRLIGLMWILSDRSKPSAPALLEEPELSLHADIMRRLPALLARAVKSSGRQVIASSHGTAMLEDPSLAPEDVVLLSPGPEGTVARVAADDSGVVTLVSSGAFTLGEALRDRLALPELGDLVALMT